jgi:hypothetical protein
VVLSVPYWLRVFYRREYRYIGYSEDHDLAYTHCQLLNYRIWEIDRKLLLHKPMHYSAISEHRRALEAAMHSVVTHTMHLRRIDLLSSAVTSLALKDTVWPSMVAQVTTQPGPGGVLMASQLIETVPADTPYRCFASIIQDHPFGMHKLHV